MSQDGRMSMAILGTGELGTAVARILLKAGVPVRLWGPRAEARAEAKRGLEGATICDTVAEAAAPADLIFLALPATRLEQVAEELGEVARGDQIVIHAARGAVDNFRLPHQLLRAETCLRKLGALGGPLHAAEIASGRPIAAVLGTRFDEVAEKVRGLTRGTPVRVHVTRDLVGVEIAGAVSNVSALAAGMAEALGLGQTTRGLLLTRGLAESSRLGAAFGADPRTFAGIAGVGDLIPRQNGGDRHGTLGRALADPATRDQALAEAGDLEGIVTAREAARAADRLGLDLPLIRAVDSVIGGSREAAAALEEVLRLDLDLDRPLARAP